MDTSIIPIQKLDSVARSYQAIQDELADDPSEDEAVRIAVKSVRNGKLLFLILHAAGIRRNNEYLMNDAATNYSPYEMRTIRLSNGGTMRITRVGSKAEKKATDQYLFQLDKGTATTVQKARAEILAALPSLTAAQ